MAVRIAPWFRREDYDAFRRLIPDDPDMPDTFDEWLKVATEQVAKSGAHGGIKQVILDPDKYARWRRAAGLDANYETIRAFAVAVANGWE